MLILSLPQSVHHMLTWWHKTPLNETPEVTGGGDRCGGFSWLNSISASGHDGEWPVQRWEGGQQIWWRWNWIAGPIEGNKQVETTSTGKCLNTPLDSKLLLYNFAPWHCSFKSQLDNFPTVGWNLATVAHYCVASERKRRKLQTSHCSSELFELRLRLRWRARILALRMFPIQEFLIINQLFHIASSLWDNIQKQNMLYLLWLQHSHSGK